MNIRQLHAEGDKETEKSLRNYIFHTGYWHKETCNFPFEDAAVCNCNHSALKKEIQLLIHREREKAYNSALDEALTALGDYKVGNYSAIEALKIKNI